METNYAAPEGGPSGRSVGPARVGTARMLRVSLLLAVALQVYVLYLHVPGPESAVAVPHADKLVHGAVFALPAALAVLGGWPLLPVALVLGAHAPLSELVQHLWLPERAGDPWDVVADCAGVGLGLLLGRVAVGRVARRARGARRRRPVGNGAR